jgi:predicted transcriptional regulator
MTAYKKDIKNVKTVCGELKALRLEMGYSIGDMAQLLNVHRGTYQGYETGRRAMPAGFINRVRDWQQIDLDFMAGMDQRIEQQLLIDGGDMWAGLSHQN